jgi:hypothetical protein
MLALKPRCVPDPFELRLGHPAERVRFELGFAMNTLPSFVAPLVQENPGEHIPVAARAMPHGELAVKERCAHAGCPAAAPSPSAASSSTM